MHTTKFDKPLISAGDILRRPWWIVVCPGGILFYYRYLVILLQVSGHRTFPQVCYRRVLDVQFRWNTPSKGNRRRLRAGYETCIVITFKVFFATRVPRDANHLLVYAMLAMYVFGKRLNEEVKIWTSSKYNKLELICLGYQRRRMLLASLPLLKQLTKQAMKALLNCPYPVRQ